MKKNVLIEKKKIPYRLIFIGAGIIGAALLFIVVFKSMSKASEPKENDVSAVTETTKEVQNTVPSETIPQESNDEYGGKAYYYSQLETLITELSALTDE